MEQEINQEMQNVPVPESPKTQGQSQQIAGAIVLAGLIIAGAIMLKGASPRVPITNPELLPSVITPMTITAEDYILGNNNAKVVLIEYADFQCPFCGKFFRETLSVLKEQYVITGKLQIVYRDFAFLGEESLWAAEAARCAGDQGKFWDYHDYLYTHQSGENRSAFSKTNLKTFAQTLSLNTPVFDRCLDAGIHEQAVLDSRTQASEIGVQSTPKSFILKNGVVVDTINGAIPTAEVITKIENALKN